jgi:hypothetical protein
VTCVPVAAGSSARGLPLVGIAPRGGCFLRKAFFKLDSEVSAEAFGADDVFAVKALAQAGSGFPRGVADAFDIGDRSETVHFSVV